MDLESESFFGAIFVVSASPPLWPSGKHPPPERQTWVRFLLSLFIFFQVESTSDLNIGTPVAMLPGSWCYSVNAGTGWPGVSIL